MPTYASLFFKFISLKYAMSISKYIQQFLDYRDLNYRDLIIPSLGRDHLESKINSDFRKKNLKSL